MTRARTVWALLLLAVAVLASTRPVWVTGAAETAVADASRVAVSGGQAAPGVTAGGAVLVAAALALALAGRVGVVVAAVVAGLGSVLVTATAVSVPARARDLAASAASDQLGVDAVRDASVGAWPWVTAVLGLLGLAVAVAAVLAARRWAGPSARHEAPAAAADAAAGASPGTARGRGRGRTGQAGAGAETPADPAEDPGGAWDALSRGEDPS